MLDYIIGLRLEEEQPTRALLRDTYVSVIGVSAKIFFFCMKAIVSEGRAFLDMLADAMSPLHFIRFFHTVKLHTDP